MRGEIDTPHRRGEIDAPRMRGEIDTPRRRGEIDAPRMRGEIDTPRRRGEIVFCVRVLGEARLTLRVGDERITRGELANWPAWEAQRRRHRPSPRASH
ncbi:hypothetical protein ACLB2K_004079 [Fragaria x ananassa]